MAMNKSDGWIQRTQNFITSEIVTDDVVDSWFLMGSIWPTAGILSAYLLFVLKIGPQMMANRKPFQMKEVLLVYNLFQVFPYGCMVYNFLWWWFFGGVQEYATTNMCSPLGKSENNRFFYPLCSQAWYFFLSKIVDLLDTVFFVLRKKQSQVTFLHVYHHAHLVFGSWIYLKYMKGEHLVLVGALNVFVHVVMYLYYFLSALGPSVRPYLWWKKYITRLQIIQFAMVISFLSALLWYDCKVKVSHYLYLTANAFGFFFLFVKFYFETYNKNKESTVMATSKKQRLANSDKNK